MTVTSRQRRRYRAATALRYGPVMDRDGSRSVEADSLLPWLGVAAALATIGGRFSRRAAMRGGLAMAVVTGTAALVARAGRIAVPRRTAGAVAFAMGAAMELPVLALPLGGAAACSAAFAVRRRRLQLVGVVASSASGAAVALATRRLWPLAPHEAADLSTALTHVDQEPSPDGQGLCVVINDRAGPSLAGSPAEELHAALPAAQIIAVDETTDLSTALERAAASSLALGVAGGDGTINAGAEVAAGAGKPLVVVPTGTLNHFARDLGLITVTDAATAVRHGQAVAVDIATIDGRPFLNTASFGSYVDLVDARQRLESKIGKWPALLAAVPRVLRASELLDVELDGVRRRVWMVFIGNCRYEPDGFSPSWRPRLDDGRLDIRVVDGSASWSRTRLGLALLSGTLGRCRAYEQWSATELEVGSLQGPLRLARDGEVFDGAERFTVTKCDRPLVVYVPYR